MAKEQISGSILKLMADIESDDDMSAMPRYVPVATFSAFSGERANLFTGKRVRFKITNIFEGRMERGHRAELTVLNITSLNWSLNFFQG